MMKMMMSVTLMVICYFDYSQRPNGIDSIKSQTNVTVNKLRRVCLFSPRISPVNSRNWRYLPRLTHRYQLSRYRTISRGDGTCAEGDRLGEHLAYPPDPPPRALHIHNIHSLNIKNDDIKTLI